MLLAGKGHETYQIFRDRTIHFDDREVAREALRAFGFRRESRVTLSIADIAEMIGAAPVRSARRRASPAGASIRARLNPGDCFFALRGPTHDGHDYVAQVFERGAAVAIVERRGAMRRACSCVVPDTTAGAAATGPQRARDAGAARSIGVTGSAGKTTTKDTIASLLATQFRDRPNHRQSSTIIWACRFRFCGCRTTAQVAVLEMGMNHAGEIRELATIAKPQIGVVTNVGWAHTENFADGIEGVARAKRELIEELPPDGIAVLNADDARVREFAKRPSGPRRFCSDLRKMPRCARKTCSCARTARVSAASGVDFESPLAGRHGVSNVLAGIAVARALGIAPERLRDAVRIARRRQDARRAHRTQRRHHYQRLL